MPQFFFLLGCWGGVRDGGQRIFFFHFLSFPMCSHQVPNGFPSYSQFVPHVLAMFLNTFPIALAFLSHMLWQILSSSHLSRWAKGNEHTFFYFGDAWSLRTTMLWGWGWGMSFLVTFEWDKLTFKKNIEKPFNYRNKIILLN